MLVGPSFSCALVVNSDTHLIGRVTIFGNIGITVSVLYHRRVFVVGAGPRGGIEIAPCANGSSITFFFTHSSGAILWNYVGSVFSLA